MFDMSNRKNTSASGISAFSCSSVFLAKISSSVGARGGAGAGRSEAHTTEPPLSPSTPLFRSHVEQEEHIGQRHFSVQLLERLLGEDLVLGRRPRGSRCR